MAVVASVLAILSQYFLPVAVPAVVPYLASFWVTVGIVYGIPIVVCLLLIGTGPLSGAVGYMRRAAVWGLGWYGGLSLLALLITFAIVVVYTLVDPSLLAPLTNTNPVIGAAEANPWFWVGFSFLAGAAEELIFRGFFFGYWLQRGTPRWVYPAIGTSALFAGVHLYYGFTYLAASPIAFVTLFLTGFAFAAAVRDSAGNLVVVALLHGASDATLFLVLIDPALGYGLHYGLILIGALVGLVAYLATRPAPPRASESWSSGVAPLPVALPISPPPTSPSSPGAPPPSP